MIECLYFAALYTADIVNTQLDTAASKPVTDNRLISAAFFTTLVVTLWTTVLIAYRIYSSSNLIPNRKKPRFYNILEIIIQSSFLYLLVLVPSALIEVIPLTQSNIAAVFTASGYLDILLVGVTVR